MVRLSLYKTVVRQPEMLLLRHPSITVVACIHAKKLELLNKIGKLFHITEFEISFTTQPYFHLKI